MCVSNIDFISSLFKYSSRKLWKLRIILKQKVFEILNVLQLCCTLERREIYVAFRFLFLLLWFFLDSFLNVVKASSHHLCPLCRMLSLFRSWRFLVRRWLDDFLFLLVSDPYVRLMSAFRFDYWSFALFGNCILRCFFNWRCFVVLRQKLKAGICKLKKFLLQLLIAADIN